MIAVDTNVVAYFFIRGEWTDAARRLWSRDSRWCLPELWRHEFLNVLATYVRHGGTDISTAHRIWLEAVDLLGSGEHAVDMTAALDLSVEWEISTYDAQFVTLAKSLVVPLVTEDRRLARAFPDTVTRLSGFRNDG